MAGLPTRKGRRGHSHRPFYIRAPSPSLQAANPSAPKSTPHLPLGPTTAGGQRRNRVKSGYLSPQFASENKKNNIFVASSTQLSTVCASALLHLELHGEETNHTGPWSPGRHSTLHPAPAPASQAQAGAQLLSRLLRESSALVPLAGLSSTRNPRQGLCEPRVEEGTDTSRWWESRTRGGETEDKGQHRVPCWGPSPPPPHTPSSSLEHSRAPPGASLPDKEQLGSETSLLALSASK